jgi:acetyl esterase/lipase
MIRDFSIRRFLRLAILVPGIAAMVPTAGSRGWEPAPATGGAFSRGGVRTRRVHSKYEIHREEFVYGDSAFLITDIRPDSGIKVYSDKESYEIRRLTVCRASTGGVMLEHQPVVVFVHGGAWTDGYADWYAFVANSFTGEERWVTVIVDYRLTSDQVFLADEYCPERATCTLPENEPYRTKAAWYPDNMDDVAGAFRWVIDHIGEHGGDVNRIALFGHSAGGHLVSLMATHPDYGVDLRPFMKGVVSMSGAYQLNDLNQVFWSQAVTQTFPDGFGDPDLLSEASPAEWIGPDVKTPPFYLLYAENDLPDLTRQAILFHDMLEGSGHTVDVTYLAGYGHESEMEAIADIDAGPTARIVEWLEKTFYGEPCCEENEE